MPKKNSNYREIEKKLRKVTFFAILLGMLCLILTGTLLYTKNLSSKAIVTAQNKSKEAIQNSEKYSELKQVLLTSKSVIDPMMNIAQDRGVDDLPKYKKLFKENVYRVIRQGNKALLSNGIEVYTEDTSYSKFKSKDVKVYPGLVFENKDNPKQVTTITRFNAVYDKGKEVEMIMELKFEKVDEEYRILSVPRFSTVDNLPTNISEKSNSTENN